MRKVLWTIAVLVIALGFAGTTAADTLQLKDGSVVQGKYLGGSERALQFEVAGKLETYPVSDILSVTFTGAANAAADSSQPASSATTGTAAISNPRPRAAPASTGVTVPAGSRIMVRMIDSVDSKTNRVGDRFHASLESDLMANGTTVAAKGTDVYGRLAEAQEAGRISGKAQVTLELTDIVIQNRMQPIVTGEYELAGDSRTASTAKRAGGGAAIGAIIGGIAGGGKGAAIGAGVGAGAGTATNAATEAEQVNVPSETVIEFRLAQPFTPQLN